MGGHESNFENELAFVTSILGLLKDEIREQTVRIGVVTFETQAKIQLSIESGDRTAGDPDFDRVVRRIESIAYPTAESLSESNLHRGLETARTQIFASLAEKDRASLDTNFIVVLTDGRLHNGYNGGAGLSSSAAQQTTKSTRFEQLRRELEHAAYGEPLRRRWGVGVGSDPGPDQETLALIAQKNQTSGLFGARAQQLKRDIADQVAAAAAGGYACTESTTKTSTPTTTATTTPCAAEDNDAALVDAAAAAGLGLRITGGCMQALAEPSLLAETLCSGAGAISDALRFRVRCPRACGLCRDTSTVTTTPSTTPTTTTSQTTSPTSSTPTTTPTLPQCWPRADVVFVIEASSKIDDVEMQPVGCSNGNNYAALKHFAADTIYELNNVQPKLYRSHLRYSAVLYADNATAYGDFTTVTSAKDSAVGIEALPYLGGGDHFTDARLDLGLEAAAAVFSAADEESYPTTPRAKITILLTDGVPPTTAEDRGLLQKALLLNRPDFAFTVGCRSDPAYLFSVTGSKTQHGNMYPTPKGADRSTFRDWLFNEESSPATSWCRGGTAPTTSAQTSTATALASTTPAVRTSTSTATTATTATSTRTRTRSSTTATTTSTTVTMSTTSTTATTSTSAPCFAVPADRDAKLAADAHAAGFVVVQSCEQALTVPLLNSLSSLCDTERGLGPALNFAELCPASCRRPGVCPAASDWLALSSSTARGQGQDESGPRQLQAPNEATWMFGGGGPGLRLLGAAAFTAHLTEAMSVAVRFRGVPGFGGYLFAKTDRLGAKRYWSLYLSAASNEFRVYTVGAAGGKLVLRFKPNKEDRFAHDGLDHKLLLVRDGNSVWLKADGKLIGGEQTLGERSATGAAVQDCSIVGPDCESWIGQRASARGGAYRYRGFLQELKVYHGHVLASYPGGWARGA